MSISVDSSGLSTLLFCLQVRGAAVHMCGTNEYRACGRRATGDANLGRLPGLAHAPAPPAAERRGKGAEGLTPPVGRQLRDMHQRRPPGSGTCRPPPTAACLHMTLALPMSPLVPNLTASLVTLISTASKERGGKAATSACAWTAAGAGHATPPAASLQHTPVPPIEVLHCLD